MGNAIKFTDQGSVTVRLQVAGEADWVAVGLEVTDTGRGIESTDQERIFERFVQADGDPSRRAAGSGLGLSITKALVELMGGALSLESVPGEGATFRVALSFPAAPGACCDQPEAAKDEACLAAE